jgi:transposase
MANKAILMSKIRQILRLYVQGTGKKQISAITGVARNTIKKYLQKFISLKITYADIEAMDDHQLDTLFTPQQQAPVDDRYEQMQQLLPEITKQLKRKGVTRIQLWEAYVQQYPDGYGRSRFNKFIQDYAGRTNPVMHIEHKAGDKVFIDFAGEKLSVVNKSTGEIEEVEVFVAILGCSQLTYAEAVMSQRKEDLISACENALHFFGGAPAAIVPDNLKSAVIKSNKYEPKLNEAFADFAEHYCMAVLPARAYRPKDKSLVEGAVKLIYRNIYTLVSKEIYTSLPALNTAIRQALQLHNNAAFKGRDYSRRQQFDELEKHALQPLAAYRYEIKQQAIATVMKDGHVNLRVDKHYYSVPYRFIGQKVKLLYTSSQVEIYHRYERIAVHQRSYAKYKYSTHTAHLASSHRYLSEWTPEKFMQKAAAIHEDVAIYVSKVIDHKQHPEQAYKSCSGILNLVRKVGNERLTGACRRADSYGIYNFPIIVEILAKKLDSIDDPMHQPEKLMPVHHNIRGNDYYQ